MRAERCPDCGEHVVLDEVNAHARIKHHADGSHTFTPPTPPRAATDPKPRGRRYA